MALRYFGFPVWRQVNMTKQIELLEQILCELKQLRIDMGIKSVSIPSIFGNGTIPESTMTVSDNGNGYTVCENAEKTNRVFTSKTKDN